MQFLDRFTGLSPFSAWFGAALVLGVALYCAWGHLAGRTERAHERDPHG
jgi:hypothetical protein